MFTNTSARDSLFCFTMPFDTVDGAPVTPAPFDWFLARTRSAQDFGAARAGEGGLGEPSEVGPSICSIGRWVELFSAVPLATLAIAPDDFRISDERLASSFVPCRGAPGPGTTGTTGTTGTVGFDPLDCDWGRTEG